MLTWLDAPLVWIDDLLTWGEDPLMALYPDGYLTRQVSLSLLYDKHAPKMHPEFARRLFAWLEHKGGTIGIGGGWRPTPDPVSPASSQGKSFHQDQRWASGITAYAAVDLVHENPGSNHRSPTWAETFDGPDYGVHTFIKSPAPEPWHMQPVEIRGWQTWVDQGRRDPQPISLPGEEDDMTPEDPPRRLIDTRPLPGKIPAGTPVTVETNVFGKAVAVNITVTQTDGPGFLIAWGAGGAPAVSNVNYDRTDQTIANHSVVPLDGSIIQFQLGGAAAHVIVDLQGTYA